MNKITFEPTEFVNVRSGSKSYGFRAYDNLHKTYCNLLEEIPDDDMDFLWYVFQYSDDVTDAMFDWMREHQQGCYIGETYYEWEEVKEILE